MKKNDIEELAAAWLAVKEAEKSAVERRREIEDAMSALLGIKAEQEGTSNFILESLNVKVVTRFTKKVDGDLAQEIASEHDLNDYLSMLFRWKPEINASAWKTCSDQIRAAFSAAITTTPGRPTFNISKKDEK